MALDILLDTATRSQVPVLIWGPPGVGKSAAIQHWARKRNLRCWTVIASLREPADFGGLPIVSQQGNETTISFAPPRFASEAAKDGGVIFLDELTTAPPAVQAALLRAVVDKAFGDLELNPKKVTLVAAANPPADAAGGWDLAPPLANRFLHHTYNVNTEDWIQQFPGYWGNPPALQFQNSGLTELAWSQGRSLVAAFIRSRPHLLLQLPKEESRKGQAWPSPRTWDYASRFLEDGRNAGKLLPLFAGCVGDGPAMEFVHWLKELDLPDPEAILANPKSYRHPERGDQAYAVLSAVAQAALARLTENRYLAA